MSGVADEANPESRRLTSPMRAHSRSLTAGVTVLLALAAGLTWLRLQRSADLVDEAFSVLVPWRWALGDKPFVDEQNLSQSAGLISYPFVKAFALLGGNDVSGLVLFDRYLYLALCVLASVCVYILARRSLSTLPAVLVAAPLVTVVLFDVPQLTANTECALLLSAGAALAGVAVLSGERWWALPAGVAFGLAGVAYPTVLLLAPFIAVCLAFSAGDRLMPMLARDHAGDAPLESLASGRLAWRVISFWALGGAFVVIPVAVTVVGIAGVENLRRSWEYTITLARRLDQLGGTDKAGEICVAFFSVLIQEWYIVAAAVASLVVFRLWPRTGRWLLLLTPPAVWLTGELSGLGVAGSVIMYGVAAPYLYLFLPAGRRRDGARLLACVWVPALLVGAMTAYTSADGLVRAAVGLLSAVGISGLFLAWGLEPGGDGRGGSWVPTLGLVAVVATTLAFQVWPADGSPNWSDLGPRMDTGPWEGVAVTTVQRNLLDGYYADLAQTGQPGDRLLAYPQGAALYLYWPGQVAANTYQLYVDDSAALLPKATLSYYLRHRTVPTLLVHQMDTAGKSPERLRQETGGLDYPLVRVSPGRVVSRKSPQETIADVLARLPRP